MENCFSKESLERISQALSAIEQTNPLFSCSLSPEKIQASEGYGQTAISIYFWNGTYRCDINRSQVLTSGSAKRANTSSAASE